MLDYVSGHRYLSLKHVLDPVEPPRYEFDFRQSSPLDYGTECEIRALFEDTAVSRDYLAAMQALVENRLYQALKECRERQERLLIYEDGGYIASRIYEIEKNPAHPYHSMVKRAIEDRTIIGAVEVTVAGERKNLQAIQQNNGRALFAVLSNARSDIKSICEAVGVGEAVLNASATSFGRLGLPTFQARRIACVGGNGAIGTRLVEQFCALHNSTANVFVVDPAKDAFELALDSSALPHAATRFQHRTLLRYRVADDCSAMSVPHAPNRAAVAGAVRTFLSESNGHRELAIVHGSFTAAELAELWADATEGSGFVATQRAVLPRGAGVWYELRRGAECKQVTLLAALTVFAFDSAIRLLRNGVDTVVGSTGIDIFGAPELDAFLSRPNPSGSADELVLISASSKDNEFRSAVALLNHLLSSLHPSPAAPVHEQLQWFASLYRQEMSFLKDEDYPALQQLFATRTDTESLQLFAEANATMAERAGLRASDATELQEQRLQTFLAAKLRKAISIRKEIRPDIGSIYHLKVNGKAKRIVVMADGFVVNFFARHEKGVKTEYIDPVITMQLLGAVRLSTTVVEPGVHKIDSYLRPQDMALLWSAINENCRPMTIRR